MTDVHTYNAETVHALVVVSAKEHGKVFEWNRGELIPLSYTEEHPPQYSDNEGFFTSSGPGHYSSGNVREEDDKRNLDRYINAITSDLKDWVHERNPEVVFVIEPEHLKGVVKEHLVTIHNTPVCTIAYGNYVEQEPEKVADLVRSALTTETDPTDPASVEGEPNAAEKKKILAVGKEVTG